MSTRAVLISLVAFSIVCGGALWLVKSGHQDKASRADRGPDLDFQRRIEARLSALESRIKSGSSEAASPDLVTADAAEEATAAGHEETPEARIARLEARIDDLELRFRATGEDPILRGHSYLQSQSVQLRRQGVSLLGALARSDPEARKALRGRLLDPDPGVREGAIEALANARDKESLPQILGLLADENGGVREEAVDAIDDILEEGNDPRAREDALSAVLPHLADADSSVRETAAETLGDLRAREAVPKLLALLEDPEGDVRENAIEALGDIGDASAVPALRDLYAKSEGEASLQLARSLHSLGDSSAMEAQTARSREVALTSADADARERAIEFLGEVAAEANRDVLEKALQDPHPEVREEAQEALRNFQRRTEGAGADRRNQEQFERRRRGGS